MNLSLPFSTKAAVVGATADGVVASDVSSTFGVVVTTSGYGSPRKLMLYVTCFEKKTISYHIKLSMFICSKFYVWHMFIFFLFFLKWLD